MNGLGGVFLVLTWFFIWKGTTPIFMVDLVALFSTNAGVGLAAVAGSWLDRQLPVEQRSSRWILWAAIAGALFINLMSAISAREVIQRYI